MSEFHVVDVTTRKLRTEPVNNPTTGKALMPMGCVVRKLRDSPDPAWWEVATEIRPGEEITGFVEHAALRPLSAVPRFWPPAIVLSSGGAGDASGPGRLSLGSNEIYRDAILAGAERSRLDPAALAALIDAEARKENGVWDPSSSNPNSSALGLTQFTKSTWLDMARRPGTLLNERSRSAGMVSASNRVVDTRKPELLQLRLDPTLSIVSAGEYARSNLEFLARKELVPAHASRKRIARLAYLAHHEGPTGAADYLGGTLTEERARKLARTNAGVEKAKAMRREHASWVAAYKAFLDAYIKKKIRPSRFRA